MFPPRLVVDQLPQDEERILVPSIGKLKSKELLKRLRPEIASMNLKKIPYAPPPLFFFAVFRDPPLLARQVYRRS
jgi:hypothetical protein